VAAAAGSVGESHLRANPAAAKPGVLEAPGGKVQKMINLGRRHDFRGNVQKTTYDEFYSLAEAGLHKEPKLILICEV
jgi:hypothetical protein